MKNKQFKTLDEQINILRNRGLIIEDEQYTKEVLFKENYFFISGYRHVFVISPKTNEFIKNTTFKELYSLFKFDRQIRNIVFKNILIVENNVKSIFSYQLSKKYGIKEKDYLDAKNFTNDNKKVRQVNDVLDKVKRQIRVNGRKHSATLHYISNYGYIPMWILIKVLSFGMISEFYSILKLEDQISIAECYKLSTSEMQRYLTVLSNYRNLCAHEDILFENRTEKNISPTKYHQLLDIPIMDEEYIYGTNDLFSVVIILRCLINKDEFNLFMSEISYEVDLLDGILKVIPIDKILSRMGFPTNFRNIVDM